MTGALGTSSMARCEQGYLCSVCGQDVEAITESELYLQYVLGEVDGEHLDRLPERHIRCHPSLAQFIVTESFPAVIVDGPFSKAQLDPEFVRQEERRITSGYLRLVELSRENRPIGEYPLRVGHTGGESAYSESGP
jgi:hypothetical protein